MREEHDDFPMQYFFDVRESIARIRLENTHLEEDEVWDLRRSLETIVNIVRYLERGAEETAQGDVKEYPYPALHKLTEGVVTFPAMLRRIDSILDKFGKIKDSASMTLATESDTTWRRPKAASRVHYILYCMQPNGMDWWTRMPHLPCATVDW